MLTLHDVIVPAVGELPVVAVLVEPTQKDLVGVTVLQVDQFPQPRQEGGVSVRAVLIWQDGDLIANLRRTGGIKDREYKKRPAAMNTTIIVFVPSPDRPLRTPLRSYVCHTEASGPEPSQHGRSPTTEKKTKQNTAAESKKLYHEASDLSNPYRERVFVLVNSISPHLQ